MIPEIGHFALILALLLALLLGALALAGAQRGRASWMAMARPLAIGQASFMGLAWACLVVSFLQNDFSFEPYALVLPRDDPDFRLLVNRTLADLYKSGGIDPIFIRWLGPYGSPGPLLNAMFYLNALPE